MRGGRLSVLLPLAVLLGPWIAGQSVRQRHGLLLVLLSLALAAAAMLRRPGFRAERSVLPVLVALAWPPALVAAAQGAIGVGRIGLVVGASTAALAVLLARVLVACSTLPAGERHARTLLERSFPDLAPVGRAELGLFWFGLFRWRRSAADAPSDAVPFPGTATGTEPAMCLLTAAGFLIETPLLHLLLAHVSTGTVAWSCTGLHVLLGVYLVGYAKSLLFRPTLLFADRLEIRLGVVARRIVPRASIAALAVHDEQEAVRAGDQRLFGLDAPNLRLSTADARILFRVDEPRRLIEALAAA